MVWWSHTEQVWKGCRQTRDSNATRKLLDRRAQLTPICLKLFNIISFNRKLSNNNNKT